MAGDTINRLEIMAGQTLYRDRKLWQAVRKKMANEGRRYNISNGKGWHAIRYTKMVTNGRRYDLGDGTKWQAIELQ